MDEETFQIIIYLLVYALLTLGLWGTIFVKAGYSGWWGLLMLIPGVNLVMIIIFLVRQWPIQREVRELRMRYGHGTEEDAYSLISEAIRLEARGKVDDALVKYQEVVTSFRDTPAGKDAQKNIEILRAGLADS